MNTIQAGEFKAKCLEIMNLVASHHEEYIITKRGVPIAKMIPIAKPQDPFGCMKGSITVMADLTEPFLTETWDADQ